MTRVGAREKERERERERERKREGDREKGCRLAGTLVSVGMSEGVV